LKDDENMVEKRSDYLQRKRSLEPWTISRFLRVILDEEAMLIFFASLV
jgi:hypothetical protein